MEEYKEEEEDREDKKLEQEEELQAEDGVDLSLSRLLSPPPPPPPPSSQQSPIPATSSPSSYLATLPRVTRRLFR